MTVKLRRKWFLHPTTFSGKDFKFLFSSPLAGRTGTPIKNSPKNDPFIGGRCNFSKYTGIFPYKNPVSDVTLHAGFEFYRDSCLGPRSYEEENTMKESI